MLGKTEIKVPSPRNDGRHCALCGCSFPAVRCDKCGSQIFCLSCDDMYHRHPKRRFHLRKAVDPTPTPQARPVLPLKVSQLTSTPGDPSKMPLPPPRKKKPGKSFFDSFRRGSPSSDNSPPLPKKEYSWTDRLGSIKKFMSNRPLPPLPKDEEENREPAPRKNDLSFIHKRVDEKPPQLPHRTQAKSPIRKVSEGDLPLNQDMAAKQTEWSSGFGVPESTFPQVPPPSTPTQHLNGQASRDSSERDTYGGRLRSKSLHDGMSPTGMPNYPEHPSISPTMPPDVRGYSTLKKPSPHGQGAHNQSFASVPGDHFLGMATSSSATDLHNLDSPPMPGPQQFGNFPMPAQYPHPYPMYPHYPNYPQYFGNSWANLATGVPNTDGDFSDQSESSSFAGKKYHKHPAFGMKAKRSQSVMYDRMAYPPQYYPFGGFPPHPPLPGYGATPWGLTDHPAETPPSPATSVRSFGRSHRSRHRKKKAVASDNDEEDERMSVRSSPRSMTTSSSDRLRKRKTPKKYERSVSPSSLTSDEDFKEKQENNIRLSPEQHMESSQGGGYQTKQEKKKVSKQGRDASKYDHKTKQGTLKAKPHQKVKADEKNFSPKFKKKEIEPPQLSESINIKAEQEEPLKRDEDNEDREDAEMLEESDYHSEEEFIEENHAAEQRGEPTLSEGHWQCEHCTFINAAEHRICQVCCKTKPGCAPASDSDSLPVPEVQASSSTAGSPDALLLNTTSESLTSDTAKDYLTPPAAEDESQSAHSENEGQKFAKLNSDLEQAEKELTRGLMELMKLNEESEASSSQAGNQIGSKDIPAAKQTIDNGQPETQPVVPAEVELPKGQTNLQPDIRSVENVVSKSTGTDSMDLDYSRNQGLDFRNNFSESSTEKGVSTTFDGPNIQGKIIAARPASEVVQASPSVQKDSSYRRDSSCQTNRENDIPQIENEIPPLYRDENMEFQYPLSRTDSIKSPQLPPMAAPGYRGFAGRGQVRMHRSHSRSSLFGDRYSDARPVQEVDNLGYGFGPSPMYRSISRSSLTGDYSDPWMSEARSLRRPDFYLSMEELVERRRQETKRIQGLELVRMIRDAEQQGFTADDIHVALNNCGKQNPVDWLQTNWRGMVDTVVTLATNYGKDKQENDIGVLSENEARDALRMHKGNIWAAVTECVEGRQRKFLELKARGNFSTKEVADAMTRSEGNVELAYTRLSATTLKPFLMRIWGTGEGVENLDGAVCDHVEFSPGPLGWPKDSTLRPGNEQCRDTERFSDQEDWDDDEDVEDEVSWNDDEEDEMESPENFNLDPHQMTNREKRAFMSNHIATPESDSEYCDAFDPIGDARSMTSSSPVDEIYFVSPDSESEPQKEKKKGISFLSRLAALRKNSKPQIEEVKVPLEQASNREVDPAESRDTSITDEEADVKSRLSDSNASNSESSKIYGPLNILKQTFSAIKDSVIGSSNKSEPKHNRSITEARTIIVHGAATQEFTSSETNAENSGTGDLKRGKLDHSQKKTDETGKTTDKSSAAEKHVKVAQGKPKAVETQKRTPDLGSTEKQIPHVQEEQKCVKMKQRIDVFDPTLKQQTQAEQESVEMHRVTDELSFRKKQPPQAEENRKNMDVKMIAAAEQPLEEKDDKGTNINKTTYKPRSPEADSSPTQQEPKTVRVPKGVNERNSTEMVSPKGQSEKTTEDNQKSDAKPVSLKKQLLVTQSEQKDEDVKRTVGKTSPTRKQTTQAQNEADDVRKIDHESAISGKPLPQTETGAISKSSSENQLITANTSKSPEGENRSPGISVEKLPMKHESRKSIEPVVEIPSDISNTIGNAVLNSTNKREGDTGSLKKKLPEKLSPSSTTEVAQSLTPDNLPEQLQDKDHISVQLEEDSGSVSPRTRHSPVKMVGEPKNDSFPDNEPKAEVSSTVELSKDKETNCAILEEHATVPDKVIESPTDARADLPENSTLASNDVASSKDQKRPGSGRDSLTPTGSTSPKDSELAGDSKASENSEVKTGRRKTKTPKDLRLKLPEPEKAIRSLTPQNRSTPELQKNESGSTENASSKMDYDSAKKTIALIEKDDKLETETVPGVTKHRTEETKTQQDSRENEIPQNAEPLPEKPTDTDSSVTNENSKKVASAENVKIQISENEFHDMATQITQKMENCLEVLKSTEAAFGESEQNTASASKKIQDPSEADAKTKIETSVARTESEIEKDKADNIKSGVSGEPSSSEKSNSAVEDVFRDTTAQNGSNLNKIHDASIKVDISVGKSDTLDVKKDTLSPTATEEKRSSVSGTVTDRVVDIPFGINDISATLETTGEDLVIPTKSDSSVPQKSLPSPTAIQVPGTSSGAKVKKFPWIVSKKSKNQLPETDTKPNITSLRGPTSSTAVSVAQSDKATDKSGSLSLVKDLTDDLKEEELIQSNDKSSEAQVHSISTSKDVKTSSSSMADDQKTSEKTGENKTLASVAEDQKPSEKTGENKTLASVPTNQNETKSSQAIPIETQQVEIPVEHVTSELPAVESAITSSDKRQSESSSNETLDSEINITSGTMHDEPSASAINITSVTMHDELSASASGVTSKMPSEEESSETPDSSTNLLAVEEVTVSASAVRRRSNKDPTTSSTQALHSPAEAPSGTMNSEAPIAPPVSGKRFRPSTVDQEVIPLTQESRSFTPIASSSERRPTSRVDVLKNSLNDAGEGSHARSQSPIRPQSPFSRMTSLTARKEAIAQERNKEIKRSPTATEKKPWFIEKTTQPPKTTFPKRSIKQQLEFERKIRKLVSERKCRTYRKAEIVVQLTELNFSEEEALQAANECSTLEQAISYLQQECFLCTGMYPVGQIVSMIHCPHKACQECIKAYFTIQIRDRTIMELLCPFCNEPDIADEDVAQDYFNHLDIMLKKLVEPDIHELFQRKLRDRVLMKDPNFRWCSQCSSGFIAMPNLKRLICPDCNAITCASCRRRWEREHEGISCEAFAIWKEANDPDSVTIDIAKLLQDDGIDCPNCHFRYALAKGGCMHFRCIQCQHDFCSGCSKPFRMGQKCGVSDFCGKLGLHAHHPRNCLFYLRDKDPEDLQRLLDLNDVQYNKDPLEEVDLKSVCQVMEQKETSDGLVDDICGKEVLESQARLCRVHYVEYLGQLVNKHKIDPIQIFCNDDLELVLRRASKRLPPRSYRDTDVKYRDKLVQLIEEELPLEQTEGS